MMQPYNQTLKNNPLKTRADYEQALISLIDPVYNLMTAQKATGRVHLGTSGAVYDEPRRDIEGFLRSLWGLGPLCSTPERAATYSTYFKAATDGILAGTDPQSPEYWGQLTDYDQLFVEMGSLATFLTLTRGFFWETLTDQQQTNIHQWLDQINHRTIPPTNWLFFRILVDSFFETVGLPVPNDQITHDLADIDGYYLDDGWYFDGYRNQIDYYIAWGMQYYGLLFSTLTPEKDNPHITAFRERGARFAATFKDWFAADGAALPFGRSQAYRFAQSSFWAAAAFTHTPLKDVSLGEAKYLLLNNMRQWFQKPIFNSDGTLSIGYGYANLNMAEGYNAPGSPYWALKNFIILALPDDDPFWQATEVQPTFTTLDQNDYSRMLMVHSQDGQELQAFTAGQHSHEHAHGAAKYEKFVYSTTFGFSTPKDTVLPKQGAFDNTLAVSENDYHYQTVFGYQGFQTHSHYVYGQWQPWPDVTIKSFIIPCYPWHIRIHVIDNQRPINLIEGSFSAPSDGQLITSQLANSCFYVSSIGTTGIVSLTPDLTTELTAPEPNTNFIYPKTVLPQLAGHLAVGQHTLISAYLGTPDQDVSLPEAIDVQLNQDQVTITIGKQQTSIKLTEI